MEERALRDLWWMRRGEHANGGGQCFDTVSWVTGRTSDP